MSENFILFKGREYPKDLFIIKEDKLYARVSSVLKPFVSFGNVPQDILKSKAILGTNVHDHIHQEIQGKFPIVEGKERGYFQSFQKWRDCLRVTFAEPEMRCYCDQKMLTGRIDALIKLENEEKSILVDWKTSAQESTVVWTLQAHLYHYLLTSQGYEIAPRFLFVKLDRYGNLPTVFKYQFNTILQDKCFQAIESFWKDWR